MSKIIELKILPQYYQDVVSGRKTFELRKDDRDYQIHDLLELKEWDGEFTGNSCRRRITYILRNCPEYGLKEGYVILGVK